MKSKVINIVILLLINGYISYSQDPIGSYRINRSMMHDNYIRSSVFSPDNSKIASCSDDKTIKLWDAKSNKELMVFVGHQDYVLFVEFINDGRNIVSCSKDETIKVWDTETGKLLRTFNHNEYSFGFAVNHKNNQIAICTRDNIKIMDLNDGNIVHTFEGNNNDIFCIAYNSEGSRIALSPNYSYDIIIIDANTGNTIQTLKGHTDRVLSISFSPDGSKLASSSLDKSVKIWDTVTSKNILSYNNRETIKDVRFSPNSKKIAYPGFMDYKSNDIHLRICDLETNKDLKILTGTLTLNNDYVDFITHLNFSLDGNLIITSSENGLIRKWSVINGKEITMNDENSLGANVVAFNKENSKVATQLLNGNVKIWDAKTGKESRNLQTFHIVNRCIEFNPQNNEIAIGIKNSIHFYNAETGVFIKKIECNSNNSHVDKLLYSPNGNIIVSQSSDSTRFWDIKSGKMIKALNNFYHVGFNPNGDKVVGQKGDEGFEIWSISNWERLKVLQMDKNDKYISQISFNPNETQLAIGMYEKIKIWNFNQPDSITILNNIGGFVNSVTFNSNGSEILTGLSNNQVKLWDSSTGHEIKNWQLNYSVNTAKFSQDEKNILVGTKAYWVSLSVKIK
jgi:WD40 repeat protein